MKETKLKDIGDRQSSQGKSLMKLLSKIKGGSSLQILEIQKMLWKGLKSPFFFSESDSDTRVLKQLTRIYSSFLKSMIKSHVRTFPESRLGTFFFKILKFREFFVFILDKTVVHYTY